MSTKISDKEEYAELIQYIQNTFKANTLSVRNLFIADLPTDYLYNIFISSLPDEIRDEYKCAKCREFFNKYGGLISIDALGNPTSVVFGNEREILEEIPHTLWFVAFIKIIKFLDFVRIKDIFITDKEILGSDKDDKWGHLHIHNVPKFITKIPKGSSAVKMQLEMRELVDDAAKFLSVIPVTELKKWLVKIKSNRDLHVFNDTAAHTIRWYLSFYRQYYDIPYSKFRSVLWKHIAESENKEIIRYTGSDLEILLENTDN